LCRIYLRNDLIISRFRVIYVHTERENTSRRIR